MRRTRWLFLAAIFPILGWVGTTYWKSKALQEHDAPTPPAPLSPTVDSKTQQLCYHDAGKYVVCATTATQLKDQIVELEEVELKLFHKDGAEFDLVRCAKAEFNLSAKTMYSEGDVEITKGADTDGPKKGRVIKINSSGVTFESQTGKAATDRPATFEFDQGGGSAVGADYDPSTGDLHLRSQVKLDWKGKTPNSAPMHVEAGEGFYKERESKVILGPWVKMTREKLQMDAGLSVINLDQGQVRMAQMQTGHGIQDDPKRRIEFSAKQLSINFADDMVVNKIVGERGSKLISTVPTMLTTVTSDNLDLDFETEGKESALTHAKASGSSVAESKPVPKVGTELADTRVLHSDVIQLKMRSGGEDIESVETDGPGTLDFLPNRAGQPKRNLKGDRIWIAYGAENRIQSFRSINAFTRTDKPPRPGHPAVSSLTQSKEILATFDPKTSELARLEQKVDFQFEEGPRHARGDRAILEQAQEVMTLDGSARVWDPTGNATADRIVMNQKSGDYTADGHVSSTRQPDQKGKGSAMLSNDEVMQARAQHMVSTDDNKKIHYEGGAVAWQGANRVEADRIDIDRTHLTTAPNGTQTGAVMEAHRNVVSQFADKDKAPSGESPAPPKPKPPIFTVVRAADMVYSDETRVVTYTGGVVMKRPDLTVTSKELRAFLKDADSDSSLDRALSDGNVKIVSTARARTRIGTSEHSEYYADESKVILTGGEPLLVDSFNNDQTRGNQLTWWANGDRLLVNGIEKTSPVKSIIRKK